MGDPFWNFFKMEAACHYWSYQSVTKSCKLTDKTGILKREGHEKYISGPKECDDTKYSGASATMKTPIRGFVTQNGTIGT